MGKPELNETVGCPVCSLNLTPRLCSSRKGKPSIMLICPQDGRHFRGFIADREFVSAVVDRMGSAGAGDTGDKPE